MPFATLLSETEKKRKINNKVSENGKTLKALDQGFSNFFTILFFTFVLYITNNFIKKKEQQIQRTAKTLNETSYTQQRTSCQRNRNGANTLVRHKQREKPTSLCCVSRISRGLVFLN